MNTPFLILIAVIVIVVGVVAIVSLFLPYLKKRGIDMDKLIGQTRQAINASSQAVEILKPFIADLPGASNVGDIFKIVDIAVGDAEHLLHIGKLPKDERETEARKYISRALSYAKIEETPEVKTLVDGALRASVEALGHKEKV